MTSELLDLAAAIAAALTAEFAPDFTATSGARPRVSAEDVQALTVMAVPAARRSDVASREATSRETEIDVILLAPVTTADAQESETEAFLGTVDEVLGFLEELRAPQGVDGPSLVVAENDPILIEELLQAHPRLLGSVITCTYASLRIAGA